MSLEKLVYMNQLFSVYQDLLTEKQKEMLSLYYEEDYSLGEIAEHYGISRQGVYDNIRRGEQALELYESKLHIIAKRNLRIEQLNNLQEITDNKELKEKINRIIDLEFDI